MIATLQRFLFARAALWAVAIAAPVLIAVGFAYYFLHSPRVTLLLSEGGAAWIRLAGPIDLKDEAVGMTYATFRTNFQLPPGFNGGELRVCALRRVAVSIDGHRIFDTGPHVTNWKAVYSVPLPPTLSIGSHLLRLSVANLSGPPLVLAYCPQLQIRTGQQWQASGDGKQWGGAALASDWTDPPLAYQFGPAALDVLSMLPLLIGLFLIGCFASKALDRARDLSPSDPNWPGRVRWALILALLVLGINNLSKVPSYIGYDATDHLDYILYVSKYWRIPLPKEGFQMFQAPIYYFLSALLYRLFIWITASPESAAQLIRVVPMLCAAAMVEICYRAARSTLPNRADLQIIAVVVGGLLPANLYMAPALSNEPLAACLGGAVVCFALAFLAQPQLTDSWKPVVCCGILLGVAILTKVSALLWILPVCGVVALSVQRRRAPFIRSILAVMLLLASVLTVSGWYFLSNWIRAGTPLYSSGGTIWQQYPGYRTPSQLFEFGHVLTRPVYSCFQSVWDSIYATLWADGCLSGIIDFEHRPPFNFRLMSCGLWLGLVPTLAIFGALVRAVLIAAGSRNAEPASTLAETSEVHQCVAPAVVWFAILSVGIFLAAIFYVYLTLPVYSCAKASYMLGAAPCIAVLAAVGFDEISRYPTLRRLSIGLFFCWAVVSYLTYFVT